MAAGRSAALEQVPADAVHLADVAMVTLLQVLEQAGTIVEPKPPKQPMTPREAAVLLCELSGSVKLSDPEEDYVQLLESPAMLTYAWSQVRSGLDAEETTAANEARRVLIAHHRPTR